MNEGIHRGIQLGLLLLLLAGCARMPITDKVQANPERPANQSDILFSVAPSGQAGDSTVLGDFIKGFMDAKQAKWAEVERLLGNAQDPLQKGLLQFSGADLLLIQVALYDHYGTSEQLLEAAGIQHPWMKSDGGNWAFGYDDAVMETADNRMKGDRIALKGKYVKSGIMEVETELYRRELLLARSVLEVVCLGEGTYLSRYFVYDAKAEMPISEVVALRVDAKTLRIACGKSSGAEQPSFPFVLEAGRDGSVELMLSPLSVDLQYSWESGALWTGTSDTPLHRATPKKTD